MAPILVSEAKFERTDGQKYIVSQMGGSTELLDGIRKLYAEGDGKREIVVGSGFGKAVDITDLDNQKIVVSIGSEYDNIVYPVYSYMSWYKDESERARVEYELAWEKKAERVYQATGEYPERGDPRYILYGGGVNLSKFVPAPMPEIEPKPLPIAPLVAVPVAAMVAVAGILVLRRRRAK